MKSVTSHRIRIASVSKDDGVSMATALKQANFIAQSFQGTLQKAKVVSQIRHKFVTNASQIHRNSYYDIYIELR